MNRLVRLFGITIFSAGKSSLSNSSGEGSWLISSSLIRTFAGMRSSLGW